MGLFSIMCHFSKQKHVNHTKPRGQKCRLRRGSGGQVQGGALTWVISIYEYPLTAASSKALTPKVPVAIMA